MRCNQPTALSVLLLGSGASFASTIQFGDFVAEFSGIAALCAIGGIASIYFGFRLFMAGVTDGKAQLTAKAKSTALAFSGVGPGLFFMAFGALVLLGVAYFSS